MFDFYVCSRYSSSNFRQQLVGIFVLCFYFFLSQLLRILLTILLHLKFFRESASDELVQDGLYFRL